MLGISSLTEVRQGSHEDWAACQLLMCRGLVPAHVCSFVGGSNSQSYQGVQVCWLCWSAYWVPIFDPSGNSSIGVPNRHLMFCLLLGGATQRTGLLGITVCKHNRVSLTMSGIGVYPWDGLQLGLVIGWLFLQFLLQPCISFRKSKFWAQSLVGRLVYLSFH